MNPIGTGFKWRRAFMFTIIVITYMLVFFQRACTSTISHSIADSYGIDHKKLSIFSSMFFYPYAVIQPFAGLLADVMEPAFLIGSFSILAAIGTVICGISNNLAVGCIGRFLVGVGCGPIFVPSCRIVANWFPLKYYSIFSGFLIALGNCGGIIGQGPLASLEQVIGWRWCFYAIAIMGVFFAICVFIFVRGHPNSFGYVAVNPDDDNADAQSSEHPQTMKDRLSSLTANFKAVVKNRYFWISGGWSIFLNGPFYNMIGMWGSPFLQSVFKWDSVKSGNAMISMSIGAIAGNIIDPFLAQLFRSKKWVLFGMSLVAALCGLPFILCPENLTFGLVICILVVFSIASNGLCPVCYAMVREYYHQSAAATAVGCINMFSFVATAIYQPVTGILLDACDPTPGAEVYSANAYKYGLWLFSVISIAICVIIIVFVKEAVDETVDGTYMAVAKEPQDPYTETLEINPGASSSHSGESRA